MIAYLLIYLISWIFIKFYQNSLRNNFDLLEF